MRDIRSTSCVGHISRHLCPIMSITAALKIPVTDVASQKDEEGDDDQKTEEWDDAFFHLCR